jgi:hypothetical protein
VTLKKLVHHRPTSWPIDKPRPHLLFLQSKPKWRFCNDVQFIITPINQNQSHFILDKFTNEFPNLTNKVFSNKISQYVGIIRMEDALVPHQYGMEVIGHQDPISYIWKVNF